MAGKRNGRARTSKRPRSPQSPVRDEPDLPEVRSEIERTLVTPLAGLFDNEEESGHARELTRQASLAPAIGRFRELLVFVGEGRRATQSGKLTPTDGVELAAVLGVTGIAALEVRSMEDLPEVPRLFHWAVAAELLSVRRKRIEPGPWADDLHRDPLSAWFKIATTLLEHGLLDGFRRGWRKQYVELLDDGAPHILAAILEAGGEVEIAAVEDLAWERVAGAYGYEPDDAAERRHVDRLVQAMFAEFADLGAAERSDRAVRLTELGGALAVAASELFDEEPMDGEGGRDSSPGGAGPDVRGRTAVTAPSPSRPADSVPEHLVSQLVGVLDGVSVDDPADLELLGGAMLVPITMPEVPDAARHAVIDAIEARADPTAAGVLAAVAVLAPSPLAAYAREAAVRLRDQGLAPRFAAHVGTLRVVAAAVETDDEAEIIVAVLARPNRSARQVLVLGIDVGTGALIDCMLTPRLSRSEADGMLRNPTGDRNAPSTVRFAPTRLRGRVTRAAGLARQLDIALGSDAAPILPIVGRALTGAPDGIPWPETLDPWDEEDDDSLPNRGPSAPHRTQGESADRRRAKRKTQRSARKRSRGR